MKGQLHIHLNLFEISGIETYDVTGLNNFVNNRDWTQ